ncbi:MAG: hypothetical protein KC496_11440, partial [Anaerolineae bacterium]|nr:hypothetical protein [Anaerolineae bacterium]
MPFDAPFPESDMFSSNRRLLERRVVTLLAHGASPDEIERQIFLYDLRQIQQQDPELAQLVRAAAIPPMLNSAVIGVLRRDQENDRQTNLDWLQKLQRLGFVKSQPIGGVTYEETARRFLLTKWEQ